jgi:hypothetical protein
MARKTPGGAEESKKPAPIISKLPIPISDSPLVIDLPDGQKLVVGRMIQGTVIEVATWRGTGRPDSRTSRLMLGMSIGDVNPPKDEPVTAAPKTVDFDGNEIPASQKRTRSSNKYIAMAQDIWLKVWGEAKPKKSPRAEKINKSGFAGKTTFAAKLPKFGKPGAAMLKRKKIGSSAFAASSSSSTSSTILAKSESRANRRETTSESDEIAAWLEEISEKARVKVEGKGTSVTKPVAPKKAAKKSANMPAKRK